MFQKLMKLSSVFADYTVGTAMVLTQLALADRGPQRRDHRAAQDPKTRTPGPGSDKPRSR